MTHRKYQPGGRRSGRRSWRWYVNAALFALADALMALGARVSRYQKPSADELEQSSMRIMSMMNSRIKHPCPTCAGRGLVYLDSDDTAVCYACAGHGVDVVYLAKVKQ